MPPPNVPSQTNMLLPPTPPQINTADELLHGVQNAAAALRGHSNLFADLTEVPKEHSQLSPHASLLL